MLRTHQNHFREIFPPPICYPEATSLTRDELAGMHIPTLGAPRVGAGCPRAMRSRPATPSTECALGFLRRASSSASLCTLGDDFEGPKSVDRCQVTGGDTQTDEYSAPLMIKVVDDVGVVVARVPSEAMSRHKNKYTPLAATRAATASSARVPSRFTSLHESCRRSSSATTPAHDSATVANSSTPASSASTSLRSFAVHDSYSRQQPRGGDLCSSVICAASAGAQVELSIVQTVAANSEADNETHDASNCSAIYLAQHASLTSNTVASLKRATVGGHRNGGGSRLRK